jgi:glucose-1-phosphate thymidylyltransferase
MKCLILAGGFGRRMAPLTDLYSKCLLPLGDRPIIDYIVERVPAGMDIIVSTSRKFENQFQDWVSGLYRPVTLVIEDSRDDRTKPGACRSILSLVQEREITEDLFIIGGDNYFADGFADFISAYDGCRPQVALYDLKDVAAARRFGVAAVKDNKLVSLVEKPSHPSGSLISTACYIFPPWVFYHLSQYCSNPARRDNLGGFISYLVALEDVAPFVLSGEWFDIGSLEVYESLVGRFSKVGVSGGQNE